MAGVYKVLLLGVVTSFFWQSNLLAKNTEVLTGFFKKFTMTDYMYLEVEVKGQRKTFYCMIPKCSDWEIKEKSFRDKKVKITVGKREFYFRETTSKKQIQEILGLKILE